MWYFTLHGSTELKQVDALTGRSGRSKPVLCVLELTARPAISMADARQLKGWNFARASPQKGPKLKPIKEFAHPPGDMRRTFHLKRPGVYLVDSVDTHNARQFYFFELTDEQVTLMTRDEVCAHFYVEQGSALLDEACAAHAWTRAWLIAQQAPEDQCDASIARCVAALRIALRDTAEVALEGRPKQIQWAEPLRLKAMSLLRVTWRSLFAHPTLPHTQPRLLYALMTCAWAFKTQPRAELFIAADYHITRAQIAELVDRFSALGKYHAGPTKSLAEPLSAEELATLQNLAGAVRP